MYLVQVKVLKFYPTSMLQFPSMFRLAYKGYVRPDHNYATQGSSLTLSVISMPVLGYRHGPHKHAFHWRLHSSKADT